MPSPHRSFRLTATEETGHHKSFRLSADARPQVGIPRRFGVGTMLILVAVFAVIFSALKTLNVPPEGFAAVSVFFAGVGLCQMLLFKGRDPRAASVVGGIVMFGLISEIGQLTGLVDFGPGNLLPAALIRLVLTSVFCGAPLGYLAGLLLAAVFLVRKEPDDNPPPREDTTPELNDFLEELKVDSPPPPKDAEGPIV
jgi:hypothetical protein